MRTGYCAVFFTEGRQWLDVGSIKPLPELVRDYVINLKKTDPFWARANVFLRIAELTISEKS